MSALESPGWVERIDHFEQRGCYELALALLRDCLRQLAADPACSQAQTQQERDWLLGEPASDSPSDDEECGWFVTSDQVFYTLGMADDGLRKYRFRRIALSDPALALKMICAPAVSAALTSISHSQQTLGNQDDLEPAPESLMKRCEPVRLRARC